MKYLIIILMAMLMLASVSAEIVCTDTSVREYGQDWNITWCYNSTDNSTWNNISVEYIYQNITITEYINQTEYLPNVTIINATYINNITYIINQTNVTQTIIDERIIYRDREVDKIVYIQNTTPASAAAVPPITSQAVQEPIQPKRINATQIPIEPEEVYNRADMGEFMKWFSISFACGLALLGIGYLIWVKFIKPKMLSKSINTQGDKTIVGAISPLTEEKSLSIKKPGE